MPYKKKEPRMYVHAWFQYFERIWNDDGSVAFDLETFKERAHAEKFRRVAKMFLQSLRDHPHHCPRETRALNKVRVQIQIRRPFPGDTEEWLVYANLMSSVPLKNIAAQAIAANP